MTLRKQLTRSYTLVAVAGILLASLVGALLIRNQQVRSAERTVALITAMVAARMEADGVRPNDPQLEHAVEAAGGRVLLVTAPDGTVLSDSVEGGNTLTGERIPARALLGAALETPRPAIRQARLGGDTYFFSTVPVRAAAEAERLIIAIPSATVLDSWLNLLPGLLLMGGLGAALAGAVAYTTSRKVTQPLEALNTAAKGMAAGDYSARVNSPGDVEELQTLANTFNTMAAEVNSARQVQRDFLANVSHDLRTPLTSIQGFSQAMMDGAVPPNQMERVATIIYSEAGRLSRLVLDLLDLARIEAGRFTMNRRDLNLKEVLTEARETFTPQAERVGVTLEMKLPSRALPLFADGDRLAQVFSNLLDNAITYAQQGGKQVKVTAALGGVRNLRSYGSGSESKVKVAAVVPAEQPTAKKEAVTADSITAPRPALQITPLSYAITPNGTTLNSHLENCEPSDTTAKPYIEAAERPPTPPVKHNHINAATADDTGATEAENRMGRWWVEVKIADTGPGIAADQQARIFERFHRGDSARSAGGMGLGLAIAKEIVEAHGGDILVEANAGQGTLFTIRLPMKMW